MKTKTTLAALLLAAVMVTPSYGADKDFLEGARYSHNFYEKRGGSNWKEWGAGCYFEGVVGAVYKLAIILPITIPEGVTEEQCSLTVAKYIVHHPEKHHYLETNLVIRAIRESWPVENNLRVDAVAKDNN